VRVEEVHRAWAPDGERWSAWVKPVLFAHLGDDVTPQLLESAAEQQGLKRALEPLRAPGSHPYRSDRQPFADVALVVDLPGASGVRLGVAAAQLGFRPVPLYNALPCGSLLQPMVDVRPIMAALVDGAERVASVPSGVPPAFLLDAARMGAARPSYAGVFDNRSMCHAADFPSSATLTQAGIERVLLVDAGGERAAADVEEVLATWQRAGLALWRAGVDSEAAGAAPWLLQRRGWLARAADAWRHRRLQRDGDAYGAFVPGSTGGGG
jgi:hypothetical protein